MFDGDYELTGKHARFIRELCKTYDDANKFQLFKNGYDVMRAAAIVGFLYGRKSEKLQKKADDENSFTIFSAQLINIKTDLDFSYRLILLLDKKNESDFDKRLEKAFNERGTEKAKNDEALFESYIRGGIEILYEKLFDTAKKSDDYLANTVSFLQEINERYNSSIDTENLIELCRKTSL